MAIIFRSQLGRELNCAEYDNNLTESLNRANHTGTQLAATISDLYQTVNAFDFIQDLISCCQTLTDALEQLRNDIFGDGGIEELIDNLRTEITNRLTIIEGDIQTLQDDIERIDALIIALEARVAFIETNYARKSGDTFSGAVIFNSTTDFNAAANFDAATTFNSSATFNSTTKVPTPPSTAADPLQVVNVGYLTDIANNINTSISLSVPVGAILPFAATSLPANYLFCNGAAVNSADYPLLAAAMGRSGVFNLPDLQAKFPIGAGGGYALQAYGGEANVTLNGDQIPGHQHSIDHNHSASGGGGGGGHSHRIRAWSYGGFNSTKQWGFGDTNDEDIGVIGKTGADYFTNNPASIPIIESASTGGSSVSVGTFYGASGWSGGGQSHNNIPPYYVVNYIIKCR